LLSSLAHFNIGSFVFTLIILGIQALIIWYLLKPEVKAAFQAPQVRAASA
jgi:cbb3-type cytochrome oxidase subunit 3